MLNLKIFISVLMFLSLQCETYKMTRCQLVDQLRKNNFHENLLRNWVCLVESESSRRTGLIGPQNKDGSRDYGLFQINDHWWCSNTTRPGKGCYTTCAELITDDITEACKCAKNIYIKQGFVAWHGWSKHCQGELPDISKCHKQVLLV